MKRTPALTAGLAVAALVLLASLCAAQFPLQMNYQVMLTDDLDQPLANQAVELVFRLYEQEAGGSIFWTETQNVVTNHIGVVSVALGSVNPMSFWTFGPLWLEVEVEGEVMSPRRQLMESAYAKVAMGALHADDADNLGMIPADAYALDDDLWQPGTLNNPANPLEWTKLKNMPAGFADGVDNAGSGDGHSLDASDGSPTDVVRVEADGTVRIGTGREETFFVSNLYVSGESDKMAALFDADSRYGFREALVARADSTSAIVGNAGNNFSSLSIPVSHTAVAGIGRGGANGGFFWAEDAGEGASGVSTGSGPAVHGWAIGTGYSGHFEGGDGVWVEVDDDYPAFLSNNHRPSDFGDAGWFLAESGVSTATWALYTRCYNGRAGYFVKNVDDDVYAMSVHNQNSNSEGLYVYGTVVSTGTMARVVETSRGSEAVLGVASADLEVIASGKGRLTGGAARVDFDRLFAEAISGPEGLRVTATPIGGWSAMYVASVDGTGFDLKSGAGDPDVEFYWMAVGRAAGSERRPEITIPDIDAERETARMKVEAATPDRPTRRENPVITTSRP